MFSLFAKIIKKLATYPKIILTVFLAIGILSIYPIMHLRWDLQLQDTITSAREPSNVQQIEDAFGGLGSLIVILQSGDSSANYRIAKNLAQTMQQSPEVHFADFETDIEFYKKNKFLYASESDIDIMVHRIRKLRHDYILKNNPLFIDLKSAIDSITQTTSEEREQLLSDLEKKYFDKLSTSHSNKNGTIRIVEIYPSHSISELQANRNLYSKVKRTLEKEEKPSDLSIHYAGKVYESIQTGKRLLPEAKMVGIVTATLILLLLILNFYKQPQLIFISALPIATPIFTTMACSYMFYGRINLFTLLLAIVLPWLTSTDESPMGTQVPIDISCATSQHALVELLGENEVVVPVGHVVDVVSRGVLGHPNFLAKRKRFLGNRFDVLERHVSIDVSSKDVHLFATGLIL